MDGQTIKGLTRRLLPRRVYDALWRLWNAARRLFIYPQQTVGAAADYDAYWARKAGQGMGQLSSFRRARAEVFAQIVAPGADVLDLGCGDGAVLKYLMDHRGVNGYGVDLSADAVAFARTQGLNVVQGEVAGPLPGAFDRDYDYVILSEIIEHLPDPEGLLLRLRGRVRAAIIVSVPNTGWWQHRLRLLLGRFPLQWVAFPGEHLRFWTLADFRWWARALGFELVRVYPYVGAPWLRQIWPALFAQAFVVVLKPR